ncbi:hypothetical protein, partial [Acinetobacter pittii]|uniref:hypothetical protein n=1 Tax=Acinetobacter pittii TaxID=48296 RepID=UPI0033342DD9
KQNKTTRPIRIRQQRRHTEPQKNRIRTLARAEAALRTGNQGSYGVQQGDGVATISVMTRLIGLWRLFGSSSPTVFELTPFPIA